MVLVADVLLVIGQLGVLGRLVLEDPVHPLVVLLDRHHSVFEHARHLAVVDQDLFRLSLKSIDQACCTVKQMENKLHTGERRQVNSIGLKSRSGKAWQKMNVLELGVHRLGELLQDLRQPLTIPDWINPVHWRRDQVEPVGVLASHGLDQGKKLTESGFNSNGNGGGAALRRRDYVSHAGHQDDVGLGSNLTETFGNDLKPTTWNELGP